jgi:hypothetical protein
LGGNRICKCKKWGRATVGLLVLSGSGRAHRKRKWENGEVEEDSKLEMDRERL